MNSSKSLPYCFREIGAISIVRSLFQKLHFKPQLASAKKSNLREDVINASLKSFLAALSPKERGILFHDLKITKGKEALTLWRLDFFKTKKFIKPDLILGSSSGAYYFGEVKIKTSSSPHHYAPEQYLKYAVLCFLQSRTQKKNVSVLHFVLAPSDDKSWLERPKHWVKDYSNQKLRVDENKLRIEAKKLTTFSNHLKRLGLHLDELFSSKGLPVVPVVTWEDFEKVLQKRHKKLRSTKDTHLLSLYGEALSLVHEVQEAKR